jgi:hypothetical protein
MNIISNNTNHETIKDDSFSILHIYGLINNINNLEILGNIKN